MDPGVKNYRQSDGYKPIAIPKALKVIKGHKEETTMESLDHFLRVRTAKLGSVQLVGFQGENLEDEHKLFAQLKQSINEMTKNKSMNQYLVILPGIRPLAAVEINETGEIPEGMTSFTIPEDEYVICRFEKKYIGEFWNAICTEENQAKYRIDLSKPRYEIFVPDHQPAEFIEWYIPTRS